MNRTLKYIAACLFAAAACAGSASAQLFPERRQIRQGNRSYEKLDYAAGEEAYSTAREMNELSYEALFNLGDAIYKQERFEEAENAFGLAASHPLASDAQRAKALFNRGNAQFSQQKLKEAEESYSHSLIFNPDDLETKYNLAYVQKLLEEQQQEQQDKPEDNDQQEQQDEGSQGGSGDEQNEERQDDQRDDSESPSKPEEKQGQQSQQQETSLGREDAEKMLDAIQQEEDKTREKTEQKNAAARAKSGKNW